MFMIHLQHRFTNFRESGAQASLILQTTSNMAGCHALNVTTHSEQQNSITCRKKYVAISFLQLFIYTCSDNIYIYIEPTLGPSDQLEVTGQVVTCSVHCMGCGRVLTTLQHPGDGCRHRRYCR